MVWLEHAIDIAAICTILAGLLLLLVSDMFDNAVLRIAASLGRFMR